MEAKIAQIIKMREEDLLSIIGAELPLERIEKYKKETGKKYRDRKYNITMTLEGFVYQASQSDKSEQNAVVHIAEHYRKVKENYEMQKAKEAEAKAEKKRYEKRGRPRSNMPRIQKSKLQEVSLNTASYDEAKKRLPLELVKMVFEDTAEYFQPQEVNQETTWKGHPVLVTDGTTFKTVDTEELREYFDSPTDKNPPPVPIGRMQGLINLYKGGILGVEIGSYANSEGRMLKKLYSVIPARAVLLGDDLYSSYGHFAYSQQKGIYLVTQGKHGRNEEIVKNYSPNDCLVKWKANQNPRWYDESDILPQEMIVRRITFINPAYPEKTITLYTTLLDNEKYQAADIAILYMSRWEIEVDFRQIKKILEMEYLRSQTVEMVMKEIYAHLILYNIIRKLIFLNSFTTDEDFPPCSSEIQIGMPVVKNENQYVDRLGRSYQRKGGNRIKANT